MYMSRLCPRSETSVLVQDLIVTDLLVTGASNRQRGGQPDRQKAQYQTGENATLAFLRLRHAIKRFPSQWIRIDDAVIFRIKMVRVGKCGKIAVQDPVCRKPPSKREEPPKTLIDLQNLLRIRLEIVNDFYPRPSYLRLGKNFCLNFPESEFTGQIRCESIG